MGSRFEQELDFVQCLANPHYLHFLAENGFLKDEEFLEYLRYLQYWAGPSYAKFIRYPHCLQMLRILLESPQFRHEVGQMGFVKYVYDQQMYHWKHYLKNVYMIDGSLPPVPVASAEGAEEGQG